MEEGGDAVRYLVPREGKWEPVTYREVGDAVREMANGLFALGLSGIIGVARWISTSSSSSGTTRLDRWQVLRLFLMPFCVSSFAALVKDQGYVLVFAPSLALNAAGFAAVAVFVAGVTRLRRGVG